MDSPRLRKSQNRPVSSALAVLIVVTYFINQELLPGRNLMLGDVFLCVTFVAAIFSYLSGGFRVMVGPSILFMLLSICIITSIHFALEDFDYSSKNSGQLLFSYGVSVVVGCYFAGTARMQLVLSTILVVSGFACLNTILYVHYNIGLANAESPDRLFLSVAGVSVFIPIGMATMAEKLEGLGKTKPTAGVFAFWIWVAFSGVYLYSGALLGQRSLFLGLVIIFSWGCLKIGNSRLLVRLIGMVPLILVSFFMLESGWDTIVGEGSSYRVMKLSDSDRISILREFVEYLRQEPGVFLVGTINFNWADSGSFQEPHNIFFHLLSDYGFFVALSVCIFYLGVLNIGSRNSCSSQRIARLAIIGMFPYLMFHTYTHIRANVVPIVLLICSALYSRRNAFFGRLVDRKVSRKLLERERLH